ncbi:TPA: ferredoxin oxidoreductase [Candidatus Berkelbacteria bacterium]|uniref:2-oxoglutarate synthase KorA n=1 Tax=Berkelbacteria bacterium GW2011_GWE1_39_12 TaxID=1618337 RepID=A0A0G4B4A2_9BACT|nr:MAG: 2-oxoglutarate synthase KorA [Berkelbacteria bacterium GW2011_GWE1_39_12]HBO60153.1 ferredoxin oxidoreductase [Candidatus Berkelbacteria bacterium]
MNKELLTGNQAIVKGALASGAQMMTGYPITPTTEILENWAEEAAKNSNLNFLQTEDEMSAGFSMIGGVLAGLKTFSATAGPGNVLMQDALVMAESMRLPTVVFINQRGGPSTGTVIYSQQELNLTCFGGNGEGLRIVYSVGNPQEMYDYAIKAFNTAWRYRFPAFVLGDGYSAKTLTEVETYSLEERKIERVSSAPYLLGEDNSSGSVNLRNTYNLETELNTLLMKHKMAFDGFTSEIVEFDDYQTLGAEIVIVAHGNIAISAKCAIDILKSEDEKVGLFRPITLNPFPSETLRSVVQKKKLIVVIESSLGQFERMVKENLYGENIPMVAIKKPALGINPDEIVERVKDFLKEMNG